MNKLYSQITSLVVIVGLGTAWAFNVVDATSFTTISVTLLSAIFALYQKYEKDEVIATNLKLEDELKITNIKLTNALVSENFIFHKYEQLQQSLLKSELNVTETPVEVVKPKRTRKK